MKTMLITVVMLSLAINCYGEQPVQAKPVEAKKAATEAKTVAEKMPPLITAEEGRTRELETSKVFTQQCRQGFQKAYADAKAYPQAKEECHGVAIVMDKRWSWIAHTSFYLYRDGAGNWKLILNRRISEKNLFLEPGEVYWESSKILSETNAGKVAWAEDPKEGFTSFNFGRRFKTAAELRKSLEDRLIVWGAEITP